MRELKVRDIVNTLLVKTTADDNLWNVIMTMKENHIRHIPVVSKDDALIGILSDRDLLVAVGTLSGSAILKKELVEKHMTKNVICCSFNDSIALVANLMGKHKIDSVPVTEGGRLVGIITSYDLLRILEKNTNS